MNPIAPCIWVAMLAPADQRVIPFIVDRAGREPDASVLDVLRTVKA